MTPTTIERRTIPIHVQTAPAKAPPKIGKLKGRQVDPAARAEVLSLIETSRWPGALRRDLLIEYLHVLNDHFGAVFERHIAALADVMRLSQAEVFEVASFYHHFEILRDDETAPRLRLRVCNGLSCEMAGAKELLAKLPALLQADVSVEPVPCIGRCEAAPAVAVGQRNVGKASASGLTSFLDRKQHVAGIDTAQSAIDLIVFDDYLASGGYGLLRDVVSGKRDHESVILALEHAGLRGLGGAGFPAGRKWRIVRDQPSPRLMAVNIDEGEPGTFKDRWYLERDPHRFLEGMLIAAQVVSISVIYIYLRDEYHELREMLQAELTKLQSNPPCDLPKIELRRGAGAYICGEESAMIESIEGKRGEPRMRPPYIAQVGLFGRPTLEHNFETLYWVREIVEKGGEWFASHGRNGRKGLRSFSVSGRVKTPGVKLAPAGISVRELIDEYCGGMADGHELYAYLPGGASGGILPASLSHVPLDFDTLQQYGCFIGSAAVIVLSQEDKARDAAINMMKFFAHESCGQCTPCRVGTEKSAKLMEAKVWDQPTLKDLSTVMVDASICGLGQAAPNPMQSVLKYFSDEVKA
ncbi:NADH-ubiquinone oxidoreductase-F iron-sulfur binding region domain-containing protein [Variovorax sp. PCZ-1]|uniref:NADH-ubiquinone oxidoreductase-F iron-sulfur binding region domain-containing protein n=1 Tax=Variovorax sp. PCZ-1 TaxID=2835533 RepID=UPI001BCF3134|nr:NADH-ubiquinone oxidoreductase-F iron-sulfur binding region domain-containing protein [Variovorax sp. PCZ-1]MBS7808202.1 NAD(P)H-dependent oxidoreductase subunit E [Variovorax sp. PCZ-1]